MLAALESVRHRSDNWARGKHQVLDVAVAPTVGANAFTAFFLSALARPAVQRGLHIPARPA
jgi:LysR family hydrogen peroxide-inducible transcriptional activator